MMGRQHVTVGACAVAVGSAAHWLPWHTPKIGLMVAGLIIGCSDAPDIDHLKSQITKSWRPLTWILCHLMRFVAKIVYAATRLPDDRRTRDPHRGFWHTWPGSLVMAVAVATACAGHQLATTAIVAMLFGVAGRCYQKAAQSYMATAGAVVGWSVWPDMDHAWPWILAAVFVGCLVHIFSDCPTKSGAPLSFPRVRTIKTFDKNGNANGEKRIRWHMSGPPEWMRFETGGAIEIWFVRLVIAGTVAIVCSLLYLWSIPLPHGS